MINVADILSTYQGLVGFKNSANSDIVPIPSSNFLVDSDSGLYVNDISGIDFALIEAILNQDYSSYVNYLTDVYNQTTINVITKFWNDYKQKQGAKELIENRVLVQEMNCYDDKKSLDNFAYGFKLKPYNSNNIRLEATKFSLHSDTDATFTLYVYDTTKKAPIETKSITVTAKTAVSVDLTKSFIYCQNNGIGTSELLILIYGYNSADYKASKQLPQNFYGYSQPFKNESKYIGISNVVFDTSAWNYNASTEVYDLPDLTKIATSCETWGMNIRLIAQCDYTQLLIDNKMLFAPIVQKAIAIRLFLDGYATTEFNAVTESRRGVWKEMAIKLEAELYGYTDEKMHTVPGYFQQVSLDLSNIDKICLPCRDEFPRVVRIGY